MHNDTTTPTNESATPIDTRIETSLYMDTIARPLAQAFPGHTIRVSDRRSIRNRAVEHARQQIAEPYIPNTIIVEPLAEYDVNDAQESTQNLSLHGQAIRPAMRYTHHFLGSMEHFPYAGLPSSQRIIGRSSAYGAYVGYHSNGGIILYLDVPMPMVTNQIMDAYIQDILHMIRPPNLADAREALQAIFFETSKHIAERSKDDAARRIHQVRNTMLLSGVEVNYAHAFDMLLAPTIDRINDTIRDTQARMRTEVMQIMDHAKVRSVVPYVLHPQGIVQGFVVHLNDITPKMGNDTEPSYTDLMLLVNTRQNSIIIAQPQRSPTPYAGMTCDPLVQHNIRNMRLNVLPSEHLFIPILELMLSNEYAQAVSRCIRYLERRNPFNPHFGG